MVVYWYDKSFSDFYDEVLGRKVENVECLEGNDYFVDVQFYLWTQMLMQGQNNPTEILRIKLLPPGCLSSLH